MDFVAFSLKVSSEEIKEILLAISDVCIYGKSEYKPSNNYAKIFYEKLLKDLSKNVKKYKSCVLNGSKGGRPRNNPSKTHGLQLGSSWRKPIETEIETETYKLKTETKKETIKKENIKENIKEKNNFDFIKNVEWKNLFLEWLEYKIKIKDSLQPVSYKPAYNKLVKLSNGDLIQAKEIINNSVANGYKGLFGLKKNLIQDKYQQNREIPL